MRQRVRCYRLEIGNELEYSTPRSITTIVLDTIIVQRKFNANKRKRFQQQNERNTQQKTMNDELPSHRRPPHHRQCRAPP